MYFIDEVASGASFAAMPGLVALLANLLQRLAGRRKVGWTTSTAFSPLGRIWSMKTKARCHASQETLLVIPRKAAVWYRILWIASPRALKSSLSSLSFLAIWSYLVTSHEPASSGCLMNFISKAKNDVKLLNKLVFFVVGTLTCRRREFAALCS